MARNVQITRSSRRRQANSIQQHRKVVRRFAGLCVLLFVLLLIVGYLLFLRDRNIHLEMPYSKTDSVFGIQKVSLENRLAPSMASELSVTAQDVPLNGVELTSGAAGLFSDENHQVLYAKNVHQKMYPASITKIMTALVALKYGNLDQIITVGEECKDIEVGSSVCEIKVGDQLSLRQLLYGLIIHSGNDAAMSIAVSVGGSVENFVSMMNKEAKAIGATNTHFVNPHGLQDEDHYTTVYDIYLMFHEALKYDEFQKIIGMASYYASYPNASGEETGIMWESTNGYFINEATPPEAVTVVGGKTGTTSDAGNCLCLYSKDAYGEPFISIILKAETKDVLYQEMNELLSKINK